MKLGLVHLYFGEGKGKTSAAVGLAVRCAGAGISVIFAQFLKGRPSSEGIALEKLGIKLVRAQASAKFSVEMSAREREKVLSENLYTLNQLEGDIKTGCGLIVLDEVVSAVGCGLLPLESLMGFIKNRPPGVEIVLTGHGDIPGELLALADYQTRFTGLRHPYDSGIPARLGIEF